MKKKSVVIGIIAICLVLAVSIAVTLKKEEKGIDIPIALANKHNINTINYGMNIDYLKETSPQHEFLSVIIEIDKLEEMSTKLERLPKELKGLQVIVELKDNQLSKADIQVIAEELGRIGEEKEIYIYLSYNEAGKSEIKEGYKLLEEIVMSTDIRIIYDKNLYSKSKNMEYIGVDIGSVEDITELKELQRQLKKDKNNHTKIIINDYIVASNHDLSITLDLINQLYYDIALYVQNGIWINQQSNLGASNPRIAEVYKKILDQVWITRQAVSGEENPYMWVDKEKLVYIEDTIEILTPVTEGVEFVEYKLNDVSQGQVSRYPYAFEYEVSDLENAYNELKVIMKLKDKEEVTVNTIYFKANVVYEESIEKAERTSPTYSKEEKMIYEHPFIPVLMYHEFMDKVGESKAEQSITVGTNLFEEQIIAMLDSGYTPITFWDLQQYFEGRGGLPEKPVIITTDDGYLSNYLIAYPILKKYNVPATYFITSYYIGVMTTRPHFTWEQAREMEESGLIDIQSHTHEHALMDSLKESAAMYQAAHSFELIEKNLGKRDVQVLSYPQFLHNDDTIKWLDEVGIDLQVTNLSKRKSTTQPLDIKRIHVSNEMTPEDLIHEIERLTMN